MTERRIHAAAGSRLNALPDKSGVPARNDVQAPDSHSRAEFQLSHKCVRRMMRLFVAAMEKWKIAN
jgi:hypothetical protein